MNASEISFDLERPENTAEIIGMSLESDQKVVYDIESDGETVTVKTETETLGVLRGCTDTMFRLTMLTDKIYSR